MTSEIGRMWEYSVHHYYLTIFQWKLQYYKFYI